MTSSQRNVRVATAAGEVQGQSIQPGTAVVLMLVSYTSTSQVYHI
jgi:linoleate 10R-lipoxygenase